jgi:DnaJ-class molecular chaperone
VAVVQMPETCCVCGGDGKLGAFMPGEPPERCPSCDGRGRVPQGTFSPEQRTLHREIERLEALSTGPPGPTEDREQSETQKGPER